MIRQAWPRPAAAPRRYAAASAALLAMALIFKQSMTSTMALHMLVHIPMILLAGAFGGRAYLSAHRHGGRGWLTGAFAKYNDYGIPGMLTVTFMMAYWMIPRSLDYVLVSVAADAGKFLGLFIAGLLLPDSLRRADKVIKLFFVGNFSWMTAIAGLLYQEHPARLCNFYLLGDQEAAGMGLVIMAAALPVLWLWAEHRQSRRR